MHTAKIVVDQYDRSTLTGVAEWVGHRSSKQKEAGSLTIRAPTWVVGQVPGWGCVGGTQLVFLSLSFSLRSPLSKK